MGSPAVAAFVGFWLFWILLVYGWASHELGPKSIGLFLTCWLVGRLCLSHIPWEPAHAMFSPYVALLDIVLVFTIFKDDVRLT
jgi:hypothetical protein